MGRKRWVAAWDEIWFDPVDLPDGILLHTFRNITCLRKTA